jgi:hypothetical protein
MTTVSISTVAGAGWQFFDNNGVPLAGGLIYTYVAGTSTPQATYTTYTGTIAHSNPIVLDSAGRVPGGEVWAISGPTYKFVLKDSSGSLLGTYDNIPSLPAAGDFVSTADLASTTDVTKGDALVGFRQSSGGSFLTGSVGRTLNDKVNETISTADFGTAQQAIDAANTNAMVQVPGTPTYSASTSWQGRQHQTDGAPFALNHITWPGANLNARMCVFDGVLYVCEYTGAKIAMFSLADPRNPSYIGSFVTGAAPRHVDVIGRYVFVCAHGANQIEVYDATVPISAGLIGTIPTGANPKMFQIVGSEIYVACYGSSTVEKYTYTLPLSGSVGFSYTKTGSQAVSNGPLCLAVNENGLLAVCGLNTADVQVLGSTALNILGTTSVGGAGHATCVWANEFQLLVTDSTNDRLYSCDCSGFGPTVTGFAATSPNPEQIEIVGNRCYVPSLTNPGEQAYLDCFDITNAAAPVKYKSVPLTVTGAGFTAYYTDGHTGYVYVNGHFSPYNIDVVETIYGIPNRPPQYATEQISARYAGFSTVLTGGLSFRYVSKTTNYTIQLQDYVVRVGLGATITLNNPALTDGKVLIIENVSTTIYSQINNPYGPVSQFTLPPNTAIVLGAQSYASAYQWDVIANFSNATQHLYATFTGAGTTTLTVDQDFVRVGNNRNLALPDPASMPGKQFIIKNVDATLSCTVSNAFLGYSGTLTAGQAVTVISADFGGTYQWDAVAAY